jgi:hypothetical protein
MPAALVIYAACLLLGLLVPAWLRLRAFRAPRAAAPARRQQARPAPCSARWLPPEPPAWAAALPRRAGMPPPAAVSPPGPPARRP